MQDIIGNRTKYILSILIRRSQRVEKAGGDYEAEIGAVGR
jgi:hypothetical protein